MMNAEVPRGLLTLHPLVPLEVRSAVTQDLVFASHSLQRADERLRAIGDYVGPELDFRDAIKTLEEFLEQLASVRHSVEVMIESAVVGWLADGMPRRADG